MRKTLSMADALLIYIIYLYGHFHEINTFAWATFPVKQRNFSHTKDIQVSWSFFIISRICPEIAGECTQNRQRSLLFFELNRLMFTLSLRVEKVLLSLLPANERSLNRTRRPFRIQKYLGKLFRCWIPWGILFTQTLCYVWMNRNYVC